MNHMPEKVTLTLNIPRILGRTEKLDPNWFENEYNRKGLQFLARVSLPLLDKVVGIDPYYFKFCHPLQLI